MVVVLVLVVRLIVLVIALIVVIVGEKELLVLADSPAPIVLLVLPIAARIVVIVAERVRRMLVHFVVFIRAMVLFGLLVRSIVRRSRGGGLLALHGAAFIFGGTATLRITHFVCMCLLQSI